MVQLSGVAPVKLASVNSVQTKQKKCLRKIVFAHTRKSVGPYYKLQEIFKLEYIYMNILSCT